MTGERAVPWTPSHIPQAPEHDRFWNALASFSGETIQLGGRKAVGLALSRPPAPDAVALRLRFEGCDLRIVAVPVEFPFPAICGADLAVADLGALPRPLRSSLLEGMTQFAAAALPEGAPRPLVREDDGTWAELREGEPAPDGFRWFRATLIGLAAQPITVDLAASLSTLIALFGAGLEPRRLWSGLERRLTREAFFTLGRITLTSAALRRVSVGTVVVLEGHHDEARAAVRVEGTVFRFGREGDKWVCLAAEPPATSRAAGGLMEDGAGDAQAGGQPETAPRTGRLTVAVDFDIGRVSVPLSELESWTTGTLVALAPFPAREGVEVTLRSNGELIGTGDLVLLDDRVAVRIARLAFEG